MNITTMLSRLRRWSTHSSSLAQQARRAARGSQERSGTTDSHRDAGRPATKAKSTYFSIGKPIDLSDYQGQTLSTRQLGTLRRKFARAIESEISQLLLLREQQNTKTAGYAASYRLNQTL